MIPILYPKTETEFTSNGLGRLADASSCVVTEERNGIFELEMSYPMKGVHFEDIEVDCFIKTICNAKKDHQLFRVYAITKPINGKCTIKAEHISYQMLHIPLMPFTAVGPAATMAAIPDHVIGDCPFTFETDLTGDRRYTLNYPKSLRGALQGDQWSILQNFSGDYEWDNWTVRLLQNRGQDKGVILRYGKNITDLKQEENIQQTYTGIVPYWYGIDGEDNILVTLPEEVIYAETAANFPYTRVLTVDFTDQMDGKPTEQELRDAANHYIERNEIGYPAVSISLSFVDLSQTEEYKDLAVETLNLCDVIEVEFMELGVSKKAKITRTKYDVLTERYTNLYIGESYHSLASIIAGQTVATEEVHVASKTAVANAIDQATTVINGDLTGSSMKTLTDNAGNPRGLIFLDTYDESTAVNCIRMNINGIGFSTVGPNGPYDTAIYYDSGLGKWVINSNYLNVVNLSADNITSGTLSSAEIDIGNGVFTVNAAGRVDASNLNITGGSINVETSVDTINVITLRSSRWYNQLSPSQIAIVNDLTTYTQRTTVLSAGIISYYDSAACASLTCSTGGGTLSLRDTSNRDMVEIRGSTNNGAIVTMYDGIDQHIAMNIGRAGVNGGLMMAFRMGGSPTVEIDGASSTLRLRTSNVTRVVLDNTGLKFYNASGTLTKTYSAT